jgi:hypothetical protein
LPTFRGAGGLGFWEKWEEKEKEEDFVHGKFLNDMILMNKSKNSIDITGN